MSPSSTAGQIFCVFFALFGIPLNMVVLNRVGKYMLAIERNICGFLEVKTGRRVRRSLITKSNIPSMFSNPSRFKEKYTSGHSSLLPPLSHLRRGVPAFLSIWCLTCQEQLSSLLCPWSCFSSRRAGLTPRPSTTALSPSVPLVLETLWQVKHSNHLWTHTVGLLKGICVILFSNFGSFNSIWLLSALYTLY